MAVSLDGRRGDSDLTHAVVKGARQKRYGHLQRGLGVALCDAALRRRLHRRFYQTGTASKELPLDIAQAESILRNLAIEIAAACHAARMDYADITFMRDDDGEWWELSYSDNGSTTVISCRGGSDG